MIPDASQKGFECASPLSLAHSGQMAVMRENDRAGPEGGCNFANDAGRIVGNSVMACGRPARKPQSEFVRGEMDERVGHSNGSTKPRWLASRRFPDGGGATHDLTAGSSRAGGPERCGGVGESVVLHPMTLVPHPAAQLRVRGRFFSNHKKLRPHSLAGEEIENLRGLAWIGAVVNREAQMAAIGSKAGFHGAEPGGIPNHAGKNQQPPEKSARKATTLHDCEVFSRKMLSPSRPRFWR